MVQVWTQSGGRTRSTDAARVKKSCPRDAGVLPKDVSESPWPASRNPSPALFLVFVFVHVYISVHSEATISMFKKQVARQVFSYRCVMHTYSLTHALSSLVQVLLGSSGGRRSGHAGVSGERGSSRPKGQRSGCWSVGSGEDLVQLPSPSVFRLLVRF